MCFARSLICSWRRPLLRLRSDSLRHQRQLELLRRLAAPRPQWNVALLQLGFALQSGHGACLSWLSSWLRIHRLCPAAAAAASSATRDRRHSTPRSPDETTSLPWLTGFSQLLTMNTEQSNQTRRRTSNFSKDCSRSYRFRSVRRHFISSTFIAVGEAQAEMRLKWLSDRLLSLTAPARSA